MRTNCFRMMRCKKWNLKTVLPNLEHVRTVLVVGKRWKSIVYNRL